MSSLTEYYHSHLFSIEYRPPFTKLLDPEVATWKLFVALTTCLKCCLVIEPPKLNIFHLICTSSVNLEFKLVNLLRFPNKQLTFPFEII